MPKYKVFVEYDFRGRGEEIWIVDADDEETAKYNYQTGIRQSKDVIREDILDRHAYRAELSNE